MVLFAAFASLPVMAEEKSPPNIIIVVLDDAGFSDYSFLGSRIQTPTIDALAANGLTLTNFYVQPRCSPTGAALLTGRDPHSVGLGFLTVPAHVEPTKGPYQGYLDPDSITLAEALKGVGYQSHLAGKWHLGERPESWPLAHGFDDYFGLISGASSYFELITDQQMVRAMARGAEEWTPAGDNFFMTDATTEFAVETLKKHKTDHPSKPFFLTLSYTAPHWPLHAPREAIAGYKETFLDGTSSVAGQRLAHLKARGVVGTDASRIDVEAAPSELMAVYAAQMTKADSGVAQITQTLEDLGYLNNTLLMIFSDNGASAEDVSTRGLHKVDARVGDLGSYLSYGRNWAKVSNTPFRGHKGSTLEGGIRSPLILHWLDGLSNQTAIDTEYVADVNDIYPTILNLAGGRVDDTLPGEDFTPLLAGENLNRARPLFWEHTGWRGVRAGNWKAVFDPREGQWVLYDIVQDPTESTNLAASHSDVIKDLRARETETAQFTSTVGIRSSFGSENVMFSGRPSKDSTFV